LYHSWMCKDTPSNFEPIIFLASTFTTYITKFSPHVMCQDLSVACISQKRLCKERVSTESSQGKQQVFPSPKRDGTREPFLLIPIRWSKSWVSKTASPIGAGQQQAEPTNFQQESRQDSLVRI
jgi:hypothetical protein